MLDHIKSPDVEFLDDFCEVERLEEGWTILRTASFGFWAYQEGHDPIILSKLEDYGQFIKDKDLLPGNSASGYSGSHRIGDIVGKRVKIRDPQEIEIPFFTNFIIPIANPIDMRLVRVESYTTEAAAVEDAKDEAGDAVIVRTIPNTVTISLDNPIDPINPLIVGDVKGIVHPTEIVEDVLKENTYLRKMLRGMLKLIPKKEIKEFTRKLEPPFKDATTDDSLEDLENQFEHYGEIVEKLVDHLESIKSITEKKSGDWQDKFDYLVNRLNEITPKRFDRVLPNDLRK